VTCLANSPAVSNITKYTKMCKRFKSKSKSSKQGIKHVRQSQPFKQSNFGTRQARSLFFRAPESTFPGNRNAHANCFISASGQCQASAIFAATIVSDSQHTITATPGGKYAK
jgi:hypothetical protein